MILYIFQSLLEKQFEELKSLSSHRNKRLTETRQLHEYNRECDEVTKWMKEKEVVTTYEETGRDLEHVEVQEKRERKEKKREYIKCVSIATCTYFVLII